MKRASLVVTIELKVDVEGQVVRDETNTLVVDDDYRIARIVATGNDGKPFMIHPSGEILWAIDAQCRDSIEEALLANS